MKPAPESDQNLERFVSAALRDLPARRAPRSLESRVLAELERRAALPWWHKSFAHWPVAVRGAFLVVSAAFAGALVWALAGFDATQAVNTVSADFTWVATLRDVTASLLDFGAIMFRGISPVWIYGGLAAIVSLYAMLFGLGTAAYRTLFANR